MQTRCGTQLANVPVRKLNMYKIKPSGLLLTSNEDVASVTLTLNYSLKLFRRDQRFTLLMRILSDEKRHETL